ncbi:hypothetical protein, partial [Mesorhizobium sp.]|uniref:hypothetical protein n=1 Tax=Mesorhizobium sp. TaxID=1871066 RepID=UPI0025886E1E
PVCGQDFDKRGVGQVLHHVKTNHQLGAAYDKGAPSSGGAFSLLFMTCSLIVLSKRRLARQLPASLSR